MVLAALALPVPLVARDEPKAPATPRVEVHETRLENGVRLLVVPRPGARTVAAGWAVAAGSAHDPEGASGLAHLLEHLLFQGTSTVGVRARGREIELLEREEALLERLRAAWRAGSTPETPFDPDGVAAELGVVTELTRIREEAAEVAIQGELALLYARSAAGELEARTFEDLALFTVVLPPEALELWFRLESDRLADPVFRQLHRELRVVAEERRRDLARDPGLGLEESVRAAIWGDHPYGRPVAGSPERLPLLPREELHRWFEETYRPSRTTLVLVGAVDPEAASRLARRTFGALPGPDGPPADEVPWAEPAEAAGSDPIRRPCEGRPRLAVAYSAVPFDHPDRPVVDLLAAVLNGRAGRLHRELVLERGAAWAAYALHRPLARGGELWFHAELRPGQPPASALRFWDRIAGALRADLVPEEELARARERLRVDTYRGMRESRGLATRLLIYDALGSWREAVRPEEAWDEVTPERLREVARRILDPERRRVGVCSPGETS